MFEPMISYAQNFEDVILRRAFARVANGFYIDVGANDPVRLSVTKHFYDHGWRGINLEPGDIFKALSEARPRDVNLNVGASNRSGVITFYEFPEIHGLSTCDPKEAAVHRDQEGLECIERQTPVMTLAEVCERHAPDEIHFMSIDVEGHERAVLEGADWKRWRPMIVLIEATRPNSTEPTHGEWESILLEADYQFATFDGLNRFYVRRESASLAEALKTPANCFDSYTLYDTVCKLEYIKRLEAEYAYHAEAHQRLAEIVAQQQRALEAAGIALPTGSKPSAARRIFARFPRAKHAIKRILGQAA